MLAMFLKVSNFLQSFAALAWIAKLSSWLGPLTPFAMGAFEGAAAVAGAVAKMLGRALAAVMADWNVLPAIVIAFVAGGWYFQPDKIEKVQVTKPAKSSVARKTHKAKPAEDRAFRIPFIF